MWIKLPHQNLRETNVTKITHLRKIQRENLWVKKITSQKTKGKNEENNSPHKNPKRKYVNKITSPKSKGNKCDQNNSPQKNPKRKFVGEKNYLTKI